MVVPSDIVPETTLNILPLSAALRSANNLVGLTRPVPARVDTLAAVVKIVPIVVFPSLPSA